MFIIYDVVHVISRTRLPLFSREMLKRLGSLGTRLGHNGDGGVWDLTKAHNFSIGIDPDHPVTRWSIAGSCSYTWYSGGFRGGGFLGFHGTPLWAGPSTKTY